MRMWAALGLVLGFSMVGCFGDSEEPAPEERETIAAADYDQSCALNLDCKPVIEGSLCGACGCPNAAINTEDESKYNAYAAGKTCEDVMGPVCNACPAQLAVCVDNKCALADPVVLRAGDYKTTCAVKEDCVAIYAGDGCAACKCENAAIHKDDLTSYNMKRAGSVCGATGVACAADCAEAQVDCVAGMCQVGAD
jgi:hypothetical protein